MSEEQVVAGSQSGSIRVWDLEAAKSECTCCCSQFKTSLEIETQDEQFVTAGLMCSVSLKQNKHKVTLESELITANFCVGE